VPRRLLFYGVTPPISCSIDLGLCNDHPLSFICLHYNTNTAGKHKRNKKKCPAVAGHEHFARQGYWKVVSRLKLSEKPHSFDIGGRAGALVALKLLVAGEETLQVFGDTRPRPVLQLQDDVLGSSGIGIGRGFVEQDIGRCVSVDAAFRPAPGKFDSRQALENGAG
jgi:hypothetical protein